MSAKKIIKTSAAPAALGPYSQAVFFENLIFISGQLGIDLKTEKLPQSIESQTKNALFHLKNILKTAGATPKNILKVTIFLKNIDDFAVMNAIYEKFFSGDFPARECVEVSRLPKNAKIEISAIAGKKDF